MLTFEQMREALARFTYKPGWELGLHLDRFEGMVLWVCTETENSYSPGDPFRLEIETFVPPMADQQALADWLLWRLGRVEVHEMREWLKVDGVAVSDPHAERRRPKPA